METLSAGVRWRSPARSTSPSSSPSRRSLPAILQVTRTHRLLTRTTHSVQAACQGCRMAFPMPPCCRPPGSQEERWHLQIVAKGRVTCPKCRSVSRKTVEGLKKHMENCRLVSPQQAPLKSTCCSDCGVLWDGSPLYLGSNLSPVSTAASSSSPPRG